MEKWKNYADNPLDIERGKIIEHIIESLGLVEISDKPNPANVRNKAYTNKNNLEKYPTLFAHSEETFVSGKEFFEKNIWLSKDDYLTLHHQNTEIEKHKNTIKNLEEHIASVHIDNTLEQRHTLSKERKELEQAIKIFEILKEKFEK